jgi:cellulose synthase/poly-beta-1,6-N-acetylglucosamine synthase-like glycosyltransferase
MRAARGRYLAHFDADDISVPERLERQVQYLETHPELAGVGCRVMLFVEPGLGLGLSACNAPETRQELTRLVARREVVIFKGPSILWRTDRLREAGGYLPGVLSDDAELTNRLLYGLGWLMLSLPEPLVWWRLNQTSISATRTAEMQREYRWLAARNAAWLEGRDPPDLEEFLDELSDGRWMRFSWWRSATAESLHRRAGRAVGHRRWVEAGLCAAGATAARPTFVARRLWSQRLSPRAARLRRHATHAHPGGPPSRPSAVTVGRANGAVNRP